MVAVRNSRIAMVAIFVNNLIKTFGDKTAVSIPEFCFPSNEIIGLVGNNGAGKTTLFRLILNLIKADSGEVNFCLSDETNNQREDKLSLSSTRVSHLEESWKNYVSAYLDESFLIDFLTPREFFTFIGKVNNIEEGRLEERIKSFSPFLSEDILNGKTYIRELSAGNKQKVGIAAALLHCPKFVILDEPFNFLDPSSQNQLKDLLSKYRQQHQASILISSHNLHHTTDISDRIVLMEKGAIIKDIDKINETTIKELENYFL